MSGRDHSVECETCGVYRGGLNDLMCECDDRDDPCVDTYWFSQNLAIAGALCASFELGYDKANEAPPWSYGGLVNGPDWAPGCGRVAPEARTSS